MPRRFHDDQDFSTDRPVTLSPRPSHHIARVLRMDADDELVVFNGRGGEWQAVIESVDKKGVRVRPHTFIARDRTPSLSVHLALPLIKGERMDYALQKAAELGVTSVSLIRYARSEVRLDEQRMTRKRDHWQGVLVSACEQCGLNRMPDLRGPTRLDDFLARAPADLGLVADADGRAPQAERLRGATSVALVTGPEGGLNDEELRICGRAGFDRLTLGERVLRAETAPVALVAALYSLADAW